MFEKIDIFNKKQEMTDSVVIIPTYNEIGNINNTLNKIENLGLKKIDINYLLTCGEDYQLIFTAKKSNSKKIISLARKNSIKITKIGNIIKKKKLVVLNKNNEELLFANLGFKHF